LDERFITSLARIELSIVDPALQIEKQGADQTR